MNTAGDYFTWHFILAPRKIIQIISNYLTFFYYYFSVKLLLKTLFSPWKRLTVQRKIGFSLEDIFHVLSFNLISRSIGFILRSMVIISWILLETAVFFFASVFLPLWLILPGFTFPLFLLLKEPADPAHELTKKNIITAKEILNFLSKTKMGQFLFPRLGISTKTISNFLTTTPSPGPESLSLDVNPSSADLFFALAKNWSPFKNFIFNLELDENDILAVCHWFVRIEQERRKKSRFWQLENLTKQGAICKDWAYGFTVDLDKYSQDLTQPLPYTHHLVGRERESQQIQQVLSRTEGNNVLLIGQPGVGRHTIILEFARRIKEGQVVHSLLNKRILSLDLTALLGSSESPEKAKSSIKSIFKEAAQAGNIILVVQNFDKFVSTGAGRIDLSDLFEEAVSGSSLQMIGVTEPAAFQKHIFPNQTIMKVFAKVEVNPPSIPEALIILQDTVPLYEKRNQVFVLYQALKEIIEKSDQYVVDIPFPEKAIDLLDEACVWAATQKKSVITPDVVDQVLAEKTKVPLGEIKKEEKEKLAHLEEILHQRVVNQELAVEQIAKAMRRARLGIAQRNKPLGTFLFLGPTGVGKTETAKALAESYFGNEEKMIRFDMSEYQGSDALKKVLGSRETEEPGIIASEIRKNPFSLLLLDEIEKAHREVLNLFLVILDEGFFTDAFARKIDCRNLIIIGTSNAGGEFIRQEISQGGDLSQLQEKVLDFVQKEEIFTPEFLNRFDAVVVYQPLSKEHLRAVAQLLLTRLNKRLKGRELTLKITDSLIEKLVDLGYNPSFGARPMNRVIQDRIEDQIAQKILSGELKRGQEVELEL
jgi:ATP-dependent Clp protease ATP-binding subunit ClpC